MSLSDKFESFWNKKPENPKPEKRSNIPPPTGPASSSADLKPQAKPKPKEPPKERTPQELDQALKQQKTEAEEKTGALDKDIAAVRAGLEKAELEAKTRRQAHQQALEFLKQDAEREIKFLERKLHEDSSAWTRQVSEREKTLEQAAQKDETAHVQKKTTFEKEEEARKETLIQTEAQIREKEAQLVQERQRWQQAMTGKEQELIILKQELVKRETMLEEELRAQDVQQKAAKELWETRLKELERQWAEKRKTWEDSMKAKDDEQRRLWGAFQEKQSAWQLEQERRLQEMTRRQERAGEKVSALQAQTTKESQAWQQLVQAREEQIKELKVKLMLSETDAKGRAEQAAKVFQDNVATIAGQVQTIQNQFAEEQEKWKKALDGKEAEILKVKDQIRAKLRELETQYTQRIAALSTEKERLTTQLVGLQQQEKEQLQHYEDRLRQLREEQTSLETRSQDRLVNLQRSSEQEVANLEAQIAALEKQKAESEKALQAMRLQWQDEARVKDEALKETQTSLGAQEAVYKTKYSAEEEVVIRQVEAQKTRIRGLERDLAKAQENAERIEQQHEASALALQKDHAEKEASLKARSDEMETRLRKRLDERRTALEAFLTMKKDEEARLQAAIKDKEKQRADLAERLEHLPELMEKAAQDKKEAIRKDIAASQQRLSALEQEVAQAREQAKTLIQGKATQLATLRQALDLKHKEMASAFKSREQIWESERAGTEKQLTQAQAEMDRVRTHWEAEINKKAQEMVALEQEMHKQEEEYRQTLEREQKVLQDQITPLEAQRQALTKSIDQERLEHAEKVRELENQSAQIQDQMQKAEEAAKKSHAEQEIRFRDERAKLKAQLQSLRSEEEGIAVAGKEALAEKTTQSEQLEEQLRQQAVAHEARKRELIHSATVKARTLQDIIHHIETELKTARETLPLDIRAREETMAKLREQLAQQEIRHQKSSARYERAMATLARRGKQKEDTLHVQITKLQEDWSKKVATRDTEIAALQSDLLAKETERQGELDRLAKQFAEERFQLEKGKEELDWKLKDHKEVSERQLSGRQKEIQYLEAEISRGKATRDQQMAQKTAAFEAEKQKIQAALGNLQNQLAEGRKNHENTIANKDQELHNLINRSKKHLTTLGEEFNQKVASWKSTNEALKGQIEQLKEHWAQAQDHWDTLRKEKANEIAGLRQELTQWEVRLQNEYQALERAHEQDRQMLLGQIRKREKEYEETQASFQRHNADKDEDMNRAVEEIKQRETASETQWKSTLDQWQTDKQTLEQEKVQLEKNLVQLQGRAEHELREMEETMSKLQMEITFKESQGQAQNDRLKSQIEKDLQPLRERQSQKSMQLQQEKALWEQRLRAKEDDLKVVKTRLAWREKRLQDEVKRREKELTTIRQVVVDELQRVRVRYDIERQRIEETLKERRAQLNALQTQAGKIRQKENNQDQTAKQTQNSQLRSLEENLQRLETQREALKNQFEPLFKEKEIHLAQLSESLEAKDRDINALRKSSKEMADKMRKDIEDLQEINLRNPMRSVRMGATAWTLFEQGVQAYKAQQWDAALRIFSECIEKDEEWGAAYQYLALVHQAQGRYDDAVEAAELALQKDPNNLQLSTWVNRLRAATEEPRRQSHG